MEVGTAVARAGAGGRVEAAGEVGVRGIAQTAGQGERFFVLVVVAAWVPASFGAAAPVQPAVLSELLKLSVAICWKARNVILAGTEQDRGATEKVIRRRSSSGAAGVGNFT